MLIDFFVHILLFYTVAISFMHIYYNISNIFCTDQSVNTIMRQNKFLLRQYNRPIFHSSHRVFTFPTSATLDILQIYI